MKKNVFAAALILALGAGSFAACSSDDVVTPEAGTQQTLGGTTFMTVKFAIPQGSGQRSNDYNFKGLWSGRDKIEGYKAYIFNAQQKLEAIQVLTTGDFAESPDGTTKELIIKPTKAIRVQPGQKVVYVVVNPNATTDALLPGVLATTTLAEFKAAYESKSLATAGQGVLSSYAAGTFATSTANVAQIKKTGADVNDVIVMTGEPAGEGGTFTVQDGVTETQAVTEGHSNQAKVNVKRTVARVVVTSTDEKYELKGDDPYTTGTKETIYKIGEVKNLHFVTAQSERELYFKQRETAWKTSTNSKWDSPASAQQATADYGLFAKSEAGKILAQYDYTNLWKNRTADDVLGGNKVHKETKAWDAKTIGELAYDCDFILPTTHKYMAAPGPYEYQKGNTAYVLVRVAFVPNEIQVGKSYKDDVLASMNSGNLVAYTAAIRAAVPNATFNDDGTVSKPVDKVLFSTLNGKEPEVLVYGLGTRKFYSSVYASQDPVFQGAKGQPVQKFTKVKDEHGAFLGYKMLYFAWVNPDVVAPTYEWYNSPVYRNNIYHVEIDGIGGLGENWNPLVPAVPGKNNNDPKHPNNPDPFVPNDHVELPKPPTDGNPSIPDPIDPPTPPTPPVKPEDPLTQKKTHMSVKVTVLPWQVHSYKFPLQN